MTASAASSQSSAKGALMVLRRPSSHPFPSTSLFICPSEIETLQVASLLALRHTATSSVFIAHFFSHLGRDVAALVTMSDGVLKPEKDYSKDADKLIPEAEQLAKV